LIPPTRVFGISSIASTSKGGNLEAGKLDLAAYQELVATYRVDQGNR
jgi:hypothetical protein